MDVVANRRPIVLVVEDNSLVRIVIANFLESAGFMVIQAADGAAALVVLASGADFNILFTDVQMPGPIDGVGVAERVREQHPGMPIVVTSGHGVPEVLPEGGRFVSKPYDNRKVVTLLRELVAA
ncbi:MAG TPA: response regulator [Caulobacteraceae bacterium]|nr:response regulator [Caulobacteraceae bacterium]